MDWLRALLLVAVVMLGSGVRHWLKFPGQWEQSFGSAYREERRALARCRTELRQAEKASAQRQYVARRELDSAEEDYRQRVAVSKERLRELQGDTAGCRVAGLGRVALHEHVLRVFDLDGKLDENGRRMPAAGSRTDYPLTGLVVECGPSGVAPETYLTIRTRAASPNLVRYRAREYPEYVVRQFALDVESAISRAGVAQVRREEEIMEAKVELAEARRATQGMEEARAMRNKVDAEESRNTAIPRARAALDTQLADWERLTGRRPLP